MTPSRDIARLLAVMEALRDPATGCPWDKAQTFATIAPYTIEEAGEVAEAIARGDMDDLRDELGDLLFQVVYHARMAEEAGAFDFGAVVEAITAKMIRRHPHVFAGGPDVSGGPAWAALKAAERAEKRRRKADLGIVEPPAGALDGVPAGLPALARARRLQEKAAAVGFDWPSAAPVLDKIREEADEVAAEIAAGAPAERVEDEIGDLIFAVVNLARHAGVDAESALRRTNEKFRRRFAAVEQALAAEGRTPAEAGLDAMEAHWQAAKAGERGQGPR